MATTFSGIQICSSRREFLLITLLAALSIHLFSTVPLQADTFEAGTRNNPMFENVYLLGAEKIKSSDATQDIQLSTLSLSGDKSNLLLLSFENEIPAALKDESGIHIVRSAYYIPRSDAKIGKRAAMFSRPEHRIVIPSSGLAGGSSPEELSMEFWIKPSHFFRKGMILQKTSVVDGLKRGLEIYLADNQLVVSFENLFADANNEVHTKTIFSRGRLDFHWHHVLVTWRANSGKITLFMDGKEDTVVFAKDSSSLFSMKFHPVDQSSIVIADNFYGMLDEFRMSSGSEAPEENNDGFSSRSRRSISPYNTLTVSPVSLRSTQKQGSALSKVIPLNQSTGGRFFYETDEGSGSMIAMFVRYSKRPFAENNQGLPWKRVGKSTDISDSFQYFQWKATFQADAEGVVTPRLKEVRLVTQREIRPPSPTNLRIIDELTIEEQIVLEWKKNPDARVDSKGGYKIYYGLKPGEYIGKIELRWVDGSYEPIRATDLTSRELTKAEQVLKEKYKKEFERHLKGKVRFRIDNQLIERNIALSQRRMPLLQTDRTYYLAISAFSDPENESDLSTEVIAVLRPKPDL